MEYGCIEPNGVIRLPQPLKPPKVSLAGGRVEAELVLLGQPQDNLLIFDQVRGAILDSSGGTVVTSSPFVGEQEVLNFLGHSGRIQEAIKELERIR